MTEKILRDFGEWVKTQPIYVGGGISDRVVLVVRNGKFESAIEVYLKEKSEERMKEVLDVIHNTIYQFFDICGDDEETPISAKDELLLEVNKAICNNLERLQQNGCIKNENMTDIDCLDEDARQASIPYTYNTPKVDSHAEYCDNIGSADMGGEGE